MKLENIKLKLGDILTFDNGRIFFEQNIEDMTDNWYYKDHLVKIERYEKCFQRLEDDVWVYELKTIWERKEEPTNDDIEEIKDKLPLLIHQRCYAEIGKNHKIELMGVFEIYQLKINQIQDKLNEVIRKTNEMGKSE